MKTSHSFPLQFVRPLAVGALALTLAVAAPRGVAANPGLNIPAPEDVKAAPASAQKTKSGLASRVLAPGTGKTHPGEFDEVTVNYTGWTTDGNCFDSSQGRGPATFKLNQVIKGWTEGVQLMVEGEKRRLWVPAALAYQGMPQYPQGMLVFDVELLSFKPGPKPPATPPDVAAIPKDAKRTKSGIGYRVLRKGTGDKHPAPSSQVTVHYSLWTTDGKFVQSSVVNGQPASFRLDQVIKGWTEAVQLMVEGEKTRFWIPEELAYKGQPNRPQGMLVFEIELLKIAS